MTRRCCSDDIAKESDPNASRRRLWMSDAAVDGNPQSRSQTITLTLYIVAKFYAEKIHRRLKQLYDLQSQNPQLHRKLTHVWKFYAKRFSARRMSELNELQSETRRSQHSQECINPRRQCFCDS